VLRTSDTAISTPSVIDDMKMKGFEPIVVPETLVIIDDYNQGTVDQITKMRDEVRVAWEQYKTGLALFGSVIVDGDDVIGNAYLRNRIFYNEMPTALQALRQADRFLFDKEPNLDNTPVFIQFISSNPAYDKAYDFGAIGIYK
jgi:hypothetical protein